MRSLPGYFKYLKKLLHPLNKSKGDKLKKSKDKVTEALNTEEIKKSPKWYEYFKKARMKQELIKEELEDYATQKKYGNNIFKPNQDDITEYAQQLKKLKLKELLLMGTLKHKQLKLDPLDRLKSINKKRHAVVTIFLDNKTTDTGVIHCYSRTFRRAKMTYMVEGDAGIYDPEFKMVHFYYWANNPFCIRFKKDKLPESFPDAKMLDNTIEFKVLEALANIDVDKKVNFLLFFGILTFVLTVANTIILIKSSGMI